MSSPINNAQPSLEDLVFIALGSNLGDSQRIIPESMERLQEFSDSPISKSGLWESTPVDCPPGSRNFINAVIGLFPRVEETPESLLRKLQTLEKEFGRQPKKILHEARALDLDLVVFGRERRQSNVLNLPHPRAHLRRFVLAPLHEIAPDFVWPGQTKTVSELLAELPVDDSVRRVSEKFPFP